MNYFFAAAAVVAVITGLVHSVFGELLIFRHLRLGKFIPTHGGKLLSEQQVRILWRRWHMVTVMGWCIAAMLGWLALPSSQPHAQGLLSWATLIALLASSALVFFGTQGKHPGWLALLCAAILTGIGRVA